MKGQLMQINSIGNGFSKLQMVNFKGSEDKELSPSEKLAIKDVARAFVNQSEVELTPSVVGLFKPEFIGGVAKIAEMQRFRYPGYVPKMGISDNFLNFLREEIKPQVLSDINNEIDALQGEIDDICVRNGVELGVRHCDAKAWFNERNPWNANVDEMDTLENMDLMPEKLFNGELDTLQPHVEVYKKDLRTGKPCGGDNFYGRDLVNVRKTNS